MFPWLMFKRVYTDFKTLRDRNDGKKNDSSDGVHRRGLLETCLNMHSCARDHSST